MKPFINVYRTDKEAVDKLEKEIGKTIFKGDKEVNLDVFEQFIKISFVIKEYDPLHNWAKSRTMYKFRQCNANDFAELNRDENDWRNFLTALCPKEEDIDPK